MLYQKNKHKNLLISKRIHGLLGIFLKALILCREIKPQISYRPKIYIQCLENQLCIWYLTYSLQVIYGRIFLDINKKLELKNPNLYFGEIKAQVLVVIFINSVLVS